MREKAFRRMTVLATVARTSGHFFIILAQIGFTEFGHLFPRAFHGLILSRLCGLRRTRTFTFRGDDPIRAGIRILVIHVNKTSQLEAVLFL